MLLVTLTFNTAREEERTLCVVYEGEDNCLSSESHGSIFLDDHLESTRICTLKNSILKKLKIEKKIEKLHYIFRKGKLILSPQEQRQGPQLKVSSEGLSTEIDILIRSPIQVQTEADVA